ncbi:TetR/AcrR family transcriptional regulator [Rhodococcus spelaei]|uniref:TetR/AcrR family transcriptional regulator n=2 Tax=Rhodococcus spelaei TaxID=2546320 RepID=A0A541BSC6_9NOCA|nr:TetR/AcrR family transcriptional regulator [Rhodococcus spelaei]
MLASAVTLFRERGVDATSFADVITRSQAPRGSIYHHFPGGKTQLAEEATLLAGRLMGSMIAANLEERGPGETLKAIVDLFRRQLLDSDFDASCPVAAAALAGGDFDAARTVAGAAFTAWESDIAAELERRGLAPDRAESVATTAIATVEGAIMVAKAQRDVRALDRAGTEVVRWIDAALAEVA